MNFDNKKMLQPAFLVCVMTFIVIGGLMKPLISFVNPFFIKHALPLKQPLDNINEKKLSPYEVVHKSKITNKEVEKALGTDEYIQWELMDTNEPANSPVRYCSLFITYYTGNPDQVPHVPEECYTGGGAQRLGTEDFKCTLSADAFEKLNEIIKYKDSYIPTRRLKFGNKNGSLWSMNQNFDVFYFFKVNGNYAGTRDSARGYLQRNFSSRYSYFSKVEWKFYNRTGYGAVYPTAEQAKAASKKLMSVILPIIEENHWPDWDKANSEQEEK